MQSYIFDFKKSPTFFKKWNKKFDVENLSSETMNIVLVDDICDDNIEDCLNSNGELKYSSPNIVSEDCTLNFVEEDVNRSYIQLDDDVTFEFGTANFSMKGAFLTTSEGYVLGYSINQYSLNITNEMIFEKDLIFFDIVEGVLNG